MHGRRLWPTGPPFDLEDKREVFDRAKAQLLDPLFRLKQQWCEAHGLHLQHPFVKDLSLRDLREWEMRLVLEHHEQEHGTELKEIEYEDVFDEEFPSTFEEIFDALEERAIANGEEFDYDDLMNEAKRIYHERTGNVWGDE